MSRAQHTRGYRRYVVELPAIASGVRMVTANLSMEGAQLVCPQLRYDLNAGPLAERPLMVWIDLDGDEVEVECGVRYVSGSEDEVLLGLAFTAETPPAVSAFLDRCGGAQYTHPVAD